MTSNYDKNELKIGFIGAGNMTRALARGIIEAGKVKPGNVIASRRCANGLQHIKKDLGIVTTQNNCEVVDNCDILFIAVKPHLVAGVLSELYERINSQHLVISIAMGWSIALLENLLPSGTRVIRTVPNTPSLVQCGATVYCKGHHATAEDEKIVEDLFSSVGMCNKLDENLLSAANGVMGSGPAYAYIAIEALSDGGVKVGLPRDLAIQLAAKTLMGAGQMVLETSRHPAQLKDSVCSPGGSTISAVKELEDGKFRSSLINAVQASCQKSIEVETKLGQTFLGGN